MRFLAAQENTTRGTKDFPIELYHVDKHHSRYEMPFHWHIESELLLILQGELSLLIDGESYLLQEGDTAFLPSGSVHGGVPKNCVYECLVFDWNYFLENYNMRFYEKYAFLFHSDIQIQHYFPASDCCSQLAVRLFEVMRERKNGYEFFTVGMLWEWLGYIFQKESYNLSSDSNRGMGKNGTQIKSVLRFIRKNYADHLTLSDLADIAGMSSEHFCRVFHQIIGRSPVDYLNYYRIECASELLCSTSDTITEIAYSCGFRDLSYFNRLFHRYKNTSPGQYRKNHRL